MDSLLVILLAVPLISAVSGAFVPEKLAKGWALLFSLITFVVSIIIAACAAGCRR